jgi:polar amino acid transport system substrate-binding protein
VTPLARPGFRLHRSRRWLVLAAAALVLVVLVALAARRLAQPPDSAWQRIQTQKVFTVATDASYPPFSSLDANGSLFGFDVDLADEIGRRWGVKVNYDNITYDALLDTLIAGRDEAVVSAFVAQPERTRQVSYTPSYFTSGTVAVTRRGQDGGQPLGSDPQAWVAGKTLAVEYGADGDALARQWASRTTGITIVRKDTADEALAVLANGQADAAIVDAISAYAFLMSHPGLALTGPPFNPEPYVIAVSINSPELLRHLQETLAAMQADGTLTGLKKKWFGAAAATN